MFLRFREPQCHDLLVEAATSLQTEPIAHQSSWPLCELRWEMVLLVPSSLL
jgi:hypothetical protein